MTFPIQRVPASRRLPSTSIQITGEPALCPPLRPPVQATPPGGSGLLCRGGALVHLISVGESPRRQHQYTSTPAPCRKGGSAYNIIKSGQIYVKASTTATLAFASFVTLTVQCQADILINNDPNGDGPGNGDFAFHLQLLASLQISFLNGAVIQITEYQAPESVQA